MLNPALIAATIAVSAEQYEQRSGHPLPSSMPFIVAPLVLHRETREALPRRISTHWPRWVADHPVLQAGFAPRALSLVGPVRDGLRFGMRVGAFTVTEGGGLTGALERGVPTSEPGDASSIVRSAAFVGRWLTKLDQPATVFALLGVTP